jgi:hypothetical protein
MSVGPCRFDRNPPQMRIAGLGNRPTLHPLSAAVLTGDRTACRRAVPTQESPVLLLGSG